MTSAEHLLALARTALAGAEPEELWQVACQHTAAGLGASWAAQTNESDHGNGNGNGNAGDMRPDGAMVRVPIGTGTTGLAVGWTEPHSLTPDDEQFLEGVRHVMETALERLRVEREVAFTAQRLAEAQELARLGSYDWNIVTDTNTWSDELYRIYGHEPGAFNASYERFLSMVHPDDRDRIVAVHTKAMEDHQPYRMEERVVRPNGELRILDSTGKVVCDDSGTPVRMVGICLDVTEQRKAADALRRSEERAAEADRQLAGAEERRSQALQINDNVVQGLTTVIYALEGASPAEALEGARATLSAASTMMSELLGLVGDALAPGDLIRRLPAPSHLPAAGPNPARPPAAEAANGHERQITVLLADDSEDLRLLYRLLLDGHGIRVVADVADGLEAVRVAQETRPDVALIDLAMPGLDGLQVTAELKRLVPDCRIVILSGFEESRVGEQSRLAGADRYLQKGVDAETLRTTLFELCAARAGL
jgi:PAS domain S-box-containing protein